MRIEDVQVLVIDDVNTMRTLTKSVLIKLGFKNITTTEGFESARELILKRHFDLLLCDWHMTPFDGMVLLRFVRNDPKLKDKLFIMVTAETTMENVRLAISTGVDDYIIKPYSLDQFQTKVIGLLTRKQVIT